MSSKNVGLEELTIFHYIKKLPDYHSLNWDLVSKLVGSDKLVNRLFVCHFLSALFIWVLSLYNNGNLNQ